MKTTRIDCHNHISGRSDDWARVDAAVKNLRGLGVEKCCSSSLPGGSQPSPEQVGKSNDITLASMKRHPDFVLGLCYVNPGYAREAQDEITRCIVDGGMTGVKLYYQYVMNEPVQFPIIERCIEIGVPILMHAGHLSAPEEAAQQPRLTGGDHYVDVSKRYPEALLICGHIGGGGDWEWQIKALRDAPSVYLDTSGSVIDAGMIERCVRDLGAERLLFGTDMNHERGVGKILDADITERQRAMIFGGNFESILARRRI
jgi:uncharacterized protein